MRRRSVRGVRGKAVWDEIVGQQPLQQPDDLSGVRRYRPESFRRSVLLRLDPDLHSFLTDFAKKHHLNRSDVINWLVMALRDADTGGLEKGLDRLLRTPETAADARRWRQWLAGLRKEFD